MSDNKLFILISIPNDFKDKFLGFVNNINVLNSDKKPPVEILEVYTEEEEEDEPQFAVIPKNKET